MISIFNTYFLPCVHKVKVMNCFSENTQLERCNYRLSVFVEKSYIVRIPSSNAACSCSFPQHLILRRVEPFDVVFVKIYSSCMHPWCVSELMHGEITLTLFINAIQSVYKRVKSGEGPVLLFLYYITAKVCNGSFVSGSCRIKSYEIIWFSLLLLNLFLSITIASACWTFTIQNNLY